MLNQKICFCGLGAYPILSQTNISLIGGAEVQQAYLAKELSNRDFDISFIAFDHGQKPIEEIERIKIFKTYSSDAPSGIQLYKLRAIWKALRHANADIYCVMASRLMLAIVTFFCFLRRKKVVYLIASEMNVASTGLKKIRWWKRILYKFAVKNADCVIAQNEYQQGLLKKNFGRDSSIIKSMHILPKEKIEKSIPPIVLWVSRITDLKQPEIFLKLANAIPRAKFQIVGGPSDDKKFYRQIKGSARNVPNLEFIGFVPYSKVNKCFERASVFVNTSTTEGFPNTFMQAWARYAPVVSLNVDPDEIICKNKLGFHSRTFEQMVEDVKSLLKDEELREEMGMNGRRYVEREHDIEKIVKEYVELFKQLTNPINNKKNSL